VGCKFADRCPAADELCERTEPELVVLGTSLVRCHHPVAVAGSVEEGAS
jgi:ABC-type dipeptide/oligopeptide/nickel transport system ATPase component